MSKDHKHWEVVVNLKAIKDHSQYLRQINQWVFDILKKHTHLNTQQNTYMLTTQYEKTQNYPKFQQNSILTQHKLNNTHTDTYARQQRHIGFKLCVTLVISKLHSYPVVLNTSWERLVVFFLFGGHSSSSFLMQVERVFSFKDEFNSDKIEVRIPEVKIIEVLVYIFII